MSIVSNITGNIYNTTLKIGFSIIALPTILILVVNLSNKILTEDLIENLQTILGYVDKILGTNNTNFILCGLSVILITRIIRFLNRFITGSLGEDKD